jgi:hypothetical protein
MICVHASDVRDDSELDRKWKGSEAKIEALQGDNKVLQLLSW